MSADCQTKTSYSANGALVGAIVGFYGLMHAIPPLCGDGSNDFCVLFEGGVTLAGALLLGAPVGYVVGSLVYKLLQMRSGSPTAQMRAWGIIAAIAFAAGLWAAGPGKDITKTALVYVCILLGLGLFWTIFIAGCIYWSDRYPYASWRRKTRIAYEIAVAVIAGALLVCYLISSDAAFKAFFCLFAVGFLFTALGAILKVLKGRPR